MLIQKNEGDRHEPEFRASQKPRPPKTLEALESAVIGLQTEQRRILAELQRIDRTGEKG